MIPVLVGLVAAAICTIGSDRVSLWKDEVDSISASTRSIPDIGRLVVHIDAVHAGYYVLLHAWTAVFGQEPWALRLLSALAIGVAAAGVWCLTTYLFDRRTALLATAVFAVLPRITWAGIETRSFALTAAAGVWLGYAFVLARAEPTRMRWARYAVAAALSVVLNIFLALVVAGHGVALLVDRVGRGRVLQWLLAAGVAVVVAGPVLVGAVGQRGQLGDESLGVAKIARSVVVNEWFLGATPDHASGLARGWAAAGVALALVGWILVIVWVVHTIRRPAEPDRGALATLVAWLVVPTAVVALYSVAVNPIYNARYFCFSAPALAIMIARGAQLIASARLRAAVLAVLVLLAVPIYVSQRAVEAKDSDWSQVAAYVQAHAAPGDGVYFTPRYPPSTTTVGTTARYAAVAYPDAYARLRDVTLLRSPTAAHSLTGQSLTLRAAVGRLAGLRTVWVLQRRDYPADEAASDRRVLAQAGLRPAGTTGFTFDVLLRFDRTAKPRHR